MVVAGWIGPDVPVDGTFGCELVVTQKKLWPNDTVVEFDYAINSTIKKLRELWGIRPMIRSTSGTVALRGYRLMIPVRWVEASLAKPNAGPVVS
jgi:hypothetical protein